MPAVHFTASPPSTFKQTFVASRVASVPRLHHATRSTHTAGVANASAPATSQALQNATPTAWRTLGTQATRWVGPGTLVGSHPFLSIAGGILGAVATTALVHDVYKKLPAPQQKRVREAIHQLARGLETVGPYATSVILAGASGTLGQEGAVRWMETRHLSATLMLVAALPMGLASLEVIGREWKIPVLRKAWSGPVDFINNHQGDVGGALLGAAGISSANFATRLIAANNPWGWALMMGSLPAILGGLELVGREHNIAALEECLTRPVVWTIDRVRQVVSKDVALHTVGATLAIAGLWGIGAGCRHLALPASSLGDALGAAQITAGTLASGLGAGIWAERRKWVPSAKQALTDYNDVMASAALSAWGAALGKFATYNIMAFGPGYLNTGAAALSLGLMSVGTIAGFRQTQKRRDAEGQGLAIIDSAMDERITTAVDRVSALSVSGASGAWTALMARGLLQSGHSSALLGALNAVPQLGATAVLGALSVGMMGHAINNRSLKRISNDVADKVKSGAEETCKFAVEHPASTLSVLGLLLVLAKRAM